MASFQPDVAHNWQCSICLEPVTDPKQLKCTHLFCQSCLGNMLNCSFQSETTSSVRCPVCGSQTDVRDGNVENLGTNLPLLFETFREEEKVQQVCDICKINSSSAIKVCQECDRKMCDQCLAKHNEWLPNLGHKILPLKKKKAFCPFHDSDDEDEQEHICMIVCMSCHTFVGCMKCMMQNHKDHKIKTPKEYKDSIEEKMGSLQRQGETKAETLKSHLTFIKCQVDRVKGYMDLRQAEIDNAYSVLYQKMKKEKALLDKQLNDERGKFFESLEIIRHHYERLLAGIESASVLADHSLKVRPLEENIITIREVLSSQLEKVLTLNKDDPDRQPATDVADWAEKLAFKASGEIDRLIGNLVFVREKHHSVKLQGKLNSMAATSDGKMAVAYGGGGIDIFSAHGQVQQSVLPNVKIREVRILSDGRYVVLDLTNNITLYTPECMKCDERFVTLDGSEGGVACLTVSNKDLIYVGYRKPKKIQEFHRRGGIAVREVQCDGFEPRQIAVDNQGSFIIKDIEMMRMVDFDGNVKYTFTTKKPNTSPYATVTKDNSILIAWVNHDEGSVSIKQYKGKVKIKTLVSDQQIEKSERNWYCLQGFRSGEIALCTPDRLNIFWL